MRCDRCRLSWAAQVLPEQRVPSSRDLHPAQDNEKWAQTPRLRLEMTHPAPLGDSISEGKEKKITSRAVRRRILDTGFGRDSQGARTIIQWDLNPLSRAAEKVNLSPSKLL